MFLAVVKPHDACIHANLLQVSDPWKLMRTLKWHSVLLFSSQSSVTRFVRQHLTGRAWEVYRDSLIGVRASKWAHVFSLGDTYV